MKKLLLLSLFLFISNSLIAQWVQIGPDLSGTISSSYGGATDLSGDGTILAIAAYTASINFDDDGMVQVLKREGDSWVQLGQDLIGTGEMGYFGRSVALNRAGNIMVVGEPYLTIPKVYVYQLVGDVWEQVGGTLYGETNSAYGLATDINDTGNRIVVGAYSVTNPAGDVGAGLIRVYDFDGTNWVQVGDGQYGNGRIDAFGWSVAMDANGDTFAAGTLGGHVKDFGYAKVFEWDVNSDNWLQKGSTMTTDEMGDSFGSYIDLSANGDHFVVTAVFHEDQIGEAYIFDFIEDEWESSTAPLTTGVEGHVFGLNPKFNRAASVLVVGSISDSQRGRAHFYKNTSGSWEVETETIFGDPKDRLTSASISVDDSGGLISLGAYGPGFTNYFLRIYQNDLFLNTEEPDSMQFQLYPNPSNGNFQIDLQSSLPITKLAMYSLDGRIIPVSYHHRQNKLWVSTQAASGVYLLTAKIGASFIQKKVVIR